MTEPLPYKAASWLWHGAIAMLFGSSAGLLIAALSEATPL